MFSKPDHIRLARLLRRTHGHWLLSYDDCPEVRSLYDWAHIVSIQATYSLVGPRQKTELLIVKPEDAAALAHLAKA